MADTTAPLTPMTASNRKHQERLDQLKAVTWRCECGAPMFSQDECYECGGEDPYGHDFCPVEEFCCGC